jgi:hypothetical protein
MKTPTEFAIIVPWTRQCFSPSAKEKHGLFETIDH